jgi:hypothetical protein
VTPGQQRHGTQCLAAVQQPRHAFAQADEGGFGVAVHGGETLDVASGRPVMAAVLAGSKRGRTSRSSRSKPMVCSAM